MINNNNYIFDPNTKFNHKINNFYLSPLPFQHHSILGSLHILELILIQFQLLFIFRIFGNNIMNNLVDLRKKMNLKCLCFYEKLLNCRLLILGFIFLIYILNLIQAILNLLVFFLKNDLDLLLEVSFSACFVNMDQTISRIQERVCKFKYNF